MICFVVKASDSLVLPYLFSLQLSWTHADEVGRGYARLLSKRRRSLVGCPTRVHFALAAAAFAARSANSCLP